MTVERKPRPTGLQSYARNPIASGRAPPDARCVPRAAWYGSPLAPRRRPTGRRRASPAGTGPAATGGQRADDPPCIPPPTILPIHPDPRMNTAAPAPMFGWMTSLADATRARLLRLVERHELAVAELCTVLQLPQSTVSRHLKVLADDGWLAVRSEGTSRFYRLAVNQLDPAARRLWALLREQTAQ